MSQYLEIKDTHKNGVNGHITVMCRIIDDTDAANGVGVYEKWGISALELSQRFDGDAEQWLRTKVTPTMQQRHADRVAAHSSLAKLKGVVLKITPDKLVALKGPVSFAKPKPDKK